MSRRIDCYPVAIIEDRYGGTYSHGKWLAIREMNNDRYRIVMMGPHSEDGDAADFWDDPPEWIAVGDTPDEALAAIYKEA
jgi:hypothetical protein